MNASFTHRVLRAVTVVVALLFALTACTGTARPDFTLVPPEPPIALPTSSLPELETLPGVALQSTTFVSVIDGDTIVTDAGTVRIIGIDTAERGQCGHNEASMSIGGMLRNGDPVTLALPAGQNNTDHHGRLIRFVFTPDGVDVGLVQLLEGHAVARYDSTDGYPRHPFEAVYHAAQVAKRAADGTVIPTVCDPSATTRPTTPSLDDGWWMQYPSCGRLKRNTVGHPTGPFSRDNPAEKEIYEWFAYGTGNNGDGDGDGLACE